MSGTTLTATNITQLNNDIATADSASSGSFTITLSGNISETAEPDAINLTNGVSLTVLGNGGARCDACHAVGRANPDANRPTAEWRA